MNALAKILPILAALLLAEIALAQAPSNRSGPSNGTRPSTIGTGSCAGTLGAEPGCTSTRGPSVGKGRNHADDSQSTDRKGANSVSCEGRGEAGGADGVGDSDGDDDRPH